MNDCGGASEFLLLGHNEWGVPVKKDGSMSPLPLFFTDVSSCDDVETVFLCFVENSLLRRCRSVCLSPGVTGFYCLTFKECIHICMNASSFCYTN